MNRRVVVDGAYCLIECAVAADGSSPADEFLDALEKGMWTDDPEPPTEFPSDEQIHDYAKLMWIMEAFGRDGFPPYARAVNYLDQGVWEFKHGGKRISYFDTLGDGSATVKVKITNRAKVPDPDGQYWWFPEFDELVRLGHCFGKTGSKSEAEDVARATQLREEDLAHDLKTA